MAGAIMPKFISDEEMMKLENQKGFLSDEQMAALESSGPSALEAGIQGAFEGASLGWRDELAGALEAGGQFLGVKGLGGKFSDIGLQDSISADQLGKVYEETKQRRERELSKIQEAQPEAFLAGNLAGGLATSFAVPNPATLGGRIAMGAGTGALAGAGQADEGKALQGAALGGLVGGAVVPAAEKVGSLLSAGAQKLSPKFSDAAETLAEKSTGATGKELQGFKSGTGRFLLDKGIIKFGDSAENIAQRAGDAMDVAGGIMDDVLKELDSKGVTISQDNIVTLLEQRLSAMKDNASLAPAARQLQSVIDDIINTGKSEISPILAEETKRGFRKIAKFNKGTDVGEAGREAYGAYQHSVEDAAQKLSPELAEQFKNVKQTWGTLAPVELAATRRTATLQQSPIGGLLDVATANAGSIGGLPGMAASAASRRIIAPRVSSSTAVTFDAIGKLLKAAPEKLGKYHRILNNSAERGINSVAITDYLLSQQDPEYREMKRQLDENR